MKRLQVSILAIVVTIVASALAFAALKTASDLWLSALYTFTTVLLLAAVIAARFRRGDEKAFWFGFAVFGCGFFVMGLGPWPSAFDGENDGTGISLNRNLLTSRVILFLVPYLRTETNDLGAIDKITTNTIGIAHLLVTLTLAIGGGVIAILIRRRRGRLASVKSLAIVVALTLVTSLIGSLGLRQSSQFGWHYSAHLAAVGETSIRMVSRRKPDPTVYRLLWLPSFHHSVCVRIDRAGEGAKLRVWVLDGKGGYEPGQIAIDKSVSLDADKVRELDHRMEQAAFWKMPTQEKRDVNVIDTDGDQLIIEGVKGGEYHIVDRRMPDQAFTTLCRQLLDLTGLKMQDTWQEYHLDDLQPEM
jgi:hypothetical protein